MFSRTLVLGGLLAAFGAGALSWISLAQTGERPQALAQAEHPGEGHGQEKLHAPEEIKLTGQQIATANISVAAAGDGKIVQRIAVPGSIVIDPDRIARVAANVIGIVVELNKRLGDPVGKNEFVAALESREVADARGEYLSARVTYELQSTLYERERALWEKQITSEQQFIKARSAFTEARVRLDLARQKLLALKLDQKEIDETLGKQASAAVEAAGLPQGSARSLRRYELRSPIAGRVVERRVDLGAPVGREGQEAEIYVIADLSTVWVELSVPAADLESVKDGQAVDIKGNGAARKATGKIIFISPMLNKETRAARVIAAIDNKDMAWRPGTFVSAGIAAGERPVNTAIPIGAIQKLKGVDAVFVRTAEGFEKREVVVGEQDSESAEVKSGLGAGEIIAVSNTFILKAELGKASAEHSD